MKKKAKRIGLRKRRPRGWKDLRACPTASEMSVFAVKDTNRIVGRIAAMLAVKSPFLSLIDVSGKERSRGELWFAWRSVKKNGRAMTFIQWAKRLKFEKFRYRLEDMEELLAKMKVCQNCGKTYAQFIAEEKI